MKRQGIFLILGLALGAVRAEVQAQSPSLRIVPDPTPLVLGLPHPVGVELVAIPEGSTLFVLLGTGPGATPALWGGRTLILPLATPTVVASAVTDGSSKWYGTILVPNNPSLVNTIPVLTAVAILPSNAVHLSLLVPSGPILEDAIS